MVSTNPPYGNGDERLYSDIVYNDGSVVTGIKNASADAKAMSVTYYDLSGRKVQNPKHGVFVKKTVMSDGKVKTGKMVVELLLYVLFVSLTFIYYFCILIF